jgi:hypothetical protein
MVDQAGYLPLGKCPNSPSGVTFGLAGLVVAASEEEVLR